VHVRIDGWMRAHKQELQTLVGPRIGIGDLIKLAHHKTQRRSIVIMYFSMSGMINQAIARGRQEPSLRICWNAIARPPGQCGQQRVGQCVFSAGDIVRARCEQRHEASIRFARYRLDRAVRPLISSRLQW
jgi:hypothetical protein